MLLEYKDRHELPDEAAAILFDHVGRTGGTTLTNMFYKHYGARALRTITNIGALSVYSNPQMDDICFFVGHGTTGIHKLLPEWKKAFYITLMRHPLQNRLSVYKYQNRHDVRAENVNPEITLDFQVYADSEQNRFVNWLGNGDLGLAEAILFERYAFFGITEFYAESMHGLSKLLPWLKAWLKEKPIPHMNRSLQDEKTISKLAMEYFLEKNSKDMELYDRAVREFKKRFPEQIASCDTVPENKEKKLGVRPFLTWINATKESLRQAERLPPDLLPSSNINAPILWARIAEAWETDEMLEAFHVLLTAAMPDIRKHNPSLDGIYAIVSFFCACRLKKYHEMHVYGNDAFDALDAVDGQNQISTLVQLRLWMLRQHHGTLQAFGKGAFSERCRSWVASLCLTPEWRGVALNAQAVLLDKYGEPAAALDSARKAIVVDPDNVEFHDVLRRLLFANGAFGEAEDAAREELARKPSSEWALRQLGLALLEKGEREEAKGVLRKAWEKNPCRKEVQVAFLRLLVDEGAVSEAEAVMRECLEFTPPWAEDLRGILDPGLSG